MTELLLRAVFTDNLALAYFLGMCTFLAMSRRLETAFGLGVGANPLLSVENVGPPFVNLILLGYGIPAVLAAVLAYVTRDTRPHWYGVMAAIAALALALGYLSLEIRTLYHGPDLTVGETTDADRSFQMTPSTKK